MPKEMLSQFMEFIHRYSPAMCLAAFGALVRALNEHKDEWSWGRFWVGLLTAAFVGLVVSYMLEPMDIPRASKNVTIALSGHLSTYMLRALTSKFQRKIDIFRG